MTNAPPGSDRHQKGEADSPLLTGPQPRCLEHLSLADCFVASLPGDEGPPRQRREVRGACWSRAEPVRASSPRLAIHSPEVCRLLGLPDDPDDRQAFAGVFSGNHLLPGSRPFAMCYGGHQFGTWAGQLGDGRAINLGEVTAADGNHWTLQLKGAGPTPYSRTADGLAVLRSSLREFLCSEAMHHLGIPTTRALCLVLTGDEVIRDMFYDGRQEVEPGAIVCRVARSFVRFGNFQILAARRDTENLRRLTGFVMRHDFGMSGNVTPDAVANWFGEVCRRTRETLLGWMRTGFVHGVLNTDNMSILGETIDYGPYGWLEGYDPQWTPNTTDAESRRYCYGAQPDVVLWNLIQLANALVPLVGAPQPLEEVLRSWAEQFHNGWRAMMAARLGLKQFEPATDPGLFSNLFELFEAAETDWTIFFRELAGIPVGEAAGESRGDAGDSTNMRSVEHLLLQPITAALYQPERLAGDLATRWFQWMETYLLRLRHDGRSDVERRTLMNRVNPRFVLRNWLAQQAIDAATGGDWTVAQQLLDVMRHPYDEQPGREQFAQRRPEWARHRAGCSMLSCSS